MHQNIKFTSFTHKLWEDFRTYSRQTSVAVEFLRLDGYFVAIGLVPRLRTFFRMTKRLPSRPESSRVLAEDCAEDKNQEDHVSLSKTWHRLFLDASRWNT